MPRDVYVLVSFGNEHFGRSTVDEKEVSGRGTVTEIERSSRKRTGKFRTGTPVFSVLFTNRARELRYRSLRKVTKKANARITNTTVSIRSSCRSYVVERNYDVLLSAENNLGRRYGRTDGRTGIDE